MARVRCDKTVSAGGMLRVHLLESKELKGKYECNLLLQGIAHRGIYTNVQKLKFLTSSCSFYITLLEASDSGGAHVIQRLISWHVVPMVSSA